MTGRDANVAVVTLFVTLACLSTPSYAQVNLDRRGFFVGIGGVFASAQFSGDDDWGNVPGLSIEGGYRFRKHWSAELEIEWLDDFEWEGGDATVELQTTLARVKWLIYTGRLQPYLTGGMGGTTARIENEGKQLSKTSDFAGQIGGGIEYYASSNVVLAVEISYRFAAGVIEGLDTSRFRASVQYRF